MEENRAENKEEKEGGNMMQLNDGELQTMYDALENQEIELAARARRRLKKNADDKFAQQSQQAAVETRLLKDKVAAILYR